MMNHDFSFIFHGPYSHEHLKMIEECRKYGEIILSTEKKYINEINKNINQYDFVSLYDNENINNIYNFQNMFKHAFSVMQGLKLSNAKYCIKFRSSHCYSNLKYIIEKIINNETDKFICDNMSINPTMPYHLSDTITGGKKSTMVGIYETLLNSLFNQDFIYEGIDIRIRAEVAFFCSFLKYKNIKINKQYDVWFIDTALNNEYYLFPMINNYLEFLKKHVDLIDVKNLLPCENKFNHVSIDLNRTYAKIEDINFVFINK
jgi:hypothetical protein